MIGYLAGSVKSINATGIILVVGGVGYRVELNARDLARVERGASAEIFCYTHVREDALQLFGFLEETARDFFGVLIGVNGVGPKSALQILSLGTVADLSAAIDRADTTFLSSVSGVGKKIAERIVLELRGKLVDLIDPAFGPAAQAIEALVHLGYRKEEAARAVRDGAATGSVEEIVRQALRLLKK